MSREFTWTDPYDDMTDEELDEHMAKLFTADRSLTSRALRFGRSLLARVTRLVSRSR